MQGELIKFVVFDDIFSEYIETHLMTVHTFFTIIIAIITIATIILTITIVQVCQIPLKHDRMDIEAHLKTAHKITCRLYELNFESGQVLIVFGTLSK